jgi:flagellar hook-associated protein 1 FlgK
MVSTFSGLSTAYSSLVAQRQALEVAGQNIANANTVGYTRQRANLVAIAGTSKATFFAKWDGVGQGVRVSNFARLNDVFIDARVRLHTASSAYLTQIATGAATLEQSFGEPGANALSAQLGALWSAFNDVANTPDLASARSVLLESASAVTSKLAALRQGVETQWQQSRTTTVALVAEANAAAANIADLNGRIQEIVNGGGSANELMDVRDQQVTRLAELVGATSTTLDDGTVEVLVGGSTMVAGTIVRQLAVTGAQTLDLAGANPLRVEWASRPGTAVGIDGGTIGGLIAQAAPAAAGIGGIHAEAVAKLDAYAVSLASSVNNALAGGLRVDGTPGTPLFALGNPPTAKTLTVAITDPDHLGVAAPGEGAYGGSLAATIAGFGTLPGGPSQQWDEIVVGLGVTVSSAVARAAVAQAARASAETDQLAQGSVDVDQETVDMIAYQRAYEGAARVLTAIDEMLDTLINRTGVVGR